MKSTKSRDLIKSVSGMMFPVEKVSNAQTFPDYQFNSKCSHSVVGEIFPGQKVVLNTCSKKYGLITNERVILPILEGLDKQLDLRVEKLMNRDNSKFYLDISIRDSVFHLMSKVDDIFPRIRINNSYDKSVKLGLEFGFYRLVCKNGLAIPVGNLDTKFKLMHTSWNADNIDKVLEQINVFLENTPKLIKSYDSMLKNKIPKSRIEEILQELLISIPQYPGKSKGKVLDRINTESGMGFELNDFVLYNALNHVLYSADMKMPEHKRDRIDHQVLHYLTAK